MFKNLLFLPVLIILTSCSLFPPYRVYEQRKEGEGELARAESNRKIKTLEAVAALESSKSMALAKIEQAKGDAQAEIERAKGAAEANRIIGESLKNNETYLKYLWITSMDGSNKEVIYIPTEANLPILEAGKR